MRVILFPVLTLLLFAVNSAGARPDFSSRIDKLFTSYIDSGFAGSVLVAKENTVVLKKGYGYSNNQTKSINTPATLFNVASVGKQFTTYAVLLSEKKRLLNINDYLSKYIGRFNDIRDSITLHQLLCHTSGLVKAGAGLDYNTRDGFIQSIKAGESDSSPEKNTGTPMQVIQCLQLSSKLPQAFPLKIS
jgi:CubicO group peptidase (beta-lactamase class C family)